MYFEKSLENTGIIGQTFSVPEISFLEYGLYKNSNNIFYFIGTIKNLSKNNIVVEIVSNAYFKNYSVGFGWGCPIIPILLPNQISPFRIFLALKDEHIDFYTIRAKFGVSNQQPYRSLKFLESGSYINKDGFFCVKGKIQNIGSRDVEYLKIVGTFYNNVDELIGVQVNQIPSKVLGVGEVSSFELILADAQTSSNVSNFCLDFWTPTGLYLVSLKW